MVSSRLLLLFSAIFMIIAQAVAQPDFLFDSCLYDRDITTFLTVPMRQISITSSSPSLTPPKSTTDSTLPLMAKTSTNSCRGDVNPDVCRCCLYNARYLLPQRCPDRKEGIGWCDHRMLRYSNRSILGVMETTSGLAMVYINNVSENYVNRSFDVVRTLPESLRSQAAAGGSFRKFAAEIAIIPYFKTLYALMQCTPDLSEQECNDCLLGAFECSNKNRFLSFAGNSFNNIIVVATIAFLVLIYSLASI